MGFDGIPHIPILCMKEVGAMKIAICDDREDDRGALKALLEAY